MSEGKTINIGGKVIDLSTLRPITVGDVKRMKTDKGISVKDLQEQDMAVQTEFILAMLQRDYPDLTMENLDELPISNLAELSEALFR